MKLVLLLVFFFSAINAHSQTFQWIWAKGTTVGLLGSGNAKANAVCHSTDSNYVYVAGQASGTSLAVVGPLLTLLSGNGQDAFVAKYTNAGALSWAITFGSGGTDEVSAIDEDASGNIVIGGSYTAATTITGKDGVTFTLPAPAGGSDVFVIKLDYRGYVQWVQTGRSTGNDYIHDLEIYNYRVYIAGEYGANFSVGPTGSPTTIANQAQTDAFGWSLTSDGALNWIKGARSNLNEAYKTVTVMASGVFFGGYFTGTSVSFLGTASSTNNNTSVGSEEGLLVKYSLAGTYLANELITGPGNAMVNDICNNGTDLFYTGYFNGNNIGFPGETAFNFANTNAYITRCDINFLTIWKKYFLSADNAKGIAIAVDAASYVITVNSYTGNVFPFSSNGGEDIITRVLNQSNGNTVSIKSNGGTNNDSPSSISIKDISNIFIVGNYGANCDFPPQPDLNSFSSLNAFWAKYGCIGAGTAAISGNSIICSGNSATLNFTFTGGAPYNITYSDGTNEYTITGITTTTSSVNVSPTSSKTYTITSFTSSGCNGTTSGSAVVTVNGSISNNVIYGDTTHCGSSGSSFTGTVPTVGSGTITYLWQYNQGSGWFNGQSTNNLQNYNSTSDPITNQYRRRVTVPGCPTNISNTVTATIVPKITNNDILNANNLCLTSGSVLLDGTLPSGGGGSYIYNWEFSQNGSAFSSIGPPVTNQDYTASTLTLITKYRRSVKTASCPNLNYSDTITIDAPMSGNVITTSSQSICQGAAINILAGVPTNGGNYTYLWEKSSDNTNWSNADSTNNTQNYTPPTLTSTTFFRRQASSGTCGFSASTSIKITVDYPILNNTISVIIDKICSTSLPDSIIGSTPTGGTVTGFSYLWQKSTSAAPTWVNASGANITSKSYLPPSITETTFFRRRVTSGVCGVVFSNVDTVYVQAPISNNSIVTPNQHICTTTQPDTIFCTVPSGGVMPYSYTWEISTVSNPTWTPLVGALSYYVPGIQTQTASFRRIVSGGLCSNSISGAHVIQIDSLILNNAINGFAIQCFSNPTVLDGTNPNGGNGTDTYSWEFSSDNISFSPVSPAVTTEDYSIATMSTVAYYRRKVTSGLCPVTYSGTVFVDVPVDNNVISSSQTICLTENPSLLTGPAPTTGAAISYLWQQSINGFTWAAITGYPNSNQNLQPTGLTALTYFRRRIATSGCGYNFSNTVAIAIDQPISNNTITATNQMICSTTIPDTIFGSISTGGSSTLTYLWEQKTMSGLTWVNANGANTSQNYLAIGLTETTVFRRRVDAGACDTSYSNLDTIFVDVPVSINSIGSDTTICYMNSPNAISGPLSSSAYGISWEQNSDSTNSSGWIGISGANAISYSPGALTDTIYLRREIEGGYCPDSYSNIVSISVSQPISNNSITGGANVCFGADSLFLPGSIIVGGVGNNTYSWEQSIDGISYSPISLNGNQNDYTTGLISSDIYYRRRVTNNVCTSQDSISNSVFIKLFENSTANFSLSKDSLCTGNDITVDISLTGAMPITLYMSFDGTNQSVSSISGAQYGYNFIPNSTNNLYLDSIQDLNGCTYSVIDTINLRLITNPNSNIAAVDVSLCDSNYTFNPSLSIGTAVLNSPTLGLLGSLFPLDYTTTTYGSHQFILTETNEICVDSDTVNIEFWREISEISAGEDQLVNDYYETHLEATDLIGTEEGKWEILSGFCHFGNQLSPQSLIYEVKSGANDLIWTVRNGVCPSKSDTVRIFIQDFFIPTGFSPNGDGTNDLFEIRGVVEFKNIGLQVFNRWGNVVYETKNYQNDWDGKHHSGEKLPDDTYFYILDMNSEEMYKGYLIIKR